MLFFQPNHSFGNKICDELNAKISGKSKWNNFNIAVAWINNAGLKNIYEPVRNFLNNKGTIIITVGLDFGSTSYEALNLLLGLEDGEANITTYVFFDENHACTFHPKVFLFTNKEKAHLLVGSNNMTGAGLDTNVEAALGFSGTVQDEIIREAHQMLATWCDVKSDTRIRRLTVELLEQLRIYGYVQTEAELRSRRKVEVQTKSPIRKPLFGRSNNRKRKVTTELSNDDGGFLDHKYTSVGDILLMRVRPRRNGQQLQISMLLHSKFMQGVDKVVSPDDSKKDIGYNKAKGINNTARFEAPEMINMKNPVARFWWIVKKDNSHKTKKDLHYEIFDADNDPTGILIFEKLKSGIKSPASTNLEKLSHQETIISKSNQEIAQWYRLDSSLN